MALPDERREPRRERWLDSAAAAAGANKSNEIYLGKQSSVKWELGPSWVKGGEVCVCGGKYIVDTAGSRRAVSFGLRHVIIIYMNTRINVTLLRL